MARLETWYKQDLKRPLVVHKHTDVFNQDSKGNLIGVEVYSDGEPVVLAGSISGYCLLADGTTVPAVGANRSGNKASVMIPQTAYSVPGPITITIKNVEDDNITTLCATVGVVRQSVSGNLVNPGSVVTDWSNNINAQLQAVQTAADNVGAIVAAPFDENTVYVVGNYVTNNGNLYRIAADHASGVAWASTAKVQCTVGHEIEALNNHFVADWNLIDPDAASDGKTDFIPVELNIRYNIIHAQSKGQFRYGLSLYDSNKTMLYISQLVDEATDGTNYSYSCTFSESAIAYVKIKINSAPSGIDTTDFSKLYFGKGSEYIEFEDYNVINTIRKVKNDVADLADEISDLNSALGTVPSGKTAQGQITDNASDISELKSAITEFESNVYPDFGYAVTVDLSYTSRDLPNHNGTFFHDTGATQKWFGSGYVEIPNGVKAIKYRGINYSASVVTPIAFYDVNKVFISAETKYTTYRIVEDTIAVPENAKYFYQSEYYSEGDSRNSNNYTIYEYGQKYDLDQMKQSTDALGSVAVKYGIEVYTSADIYLADGTARTFSGWHSTDFIKCTGRDSIQYDAYSFYNGTIDVAYISYFDENRQFIGCLKSSDVTTGEQFGSATLPSGCAYVRGVTGGTIDPYIILNTTGFIKDIVAGNPLTNGTKICCVGDSLTKGVDVGSHVIKENYPYFMSQYLNCDIVNYGETGRSSKTWWDNYKDVHLFDPSMDIILIMFGTNGGLATNTLSTDVEPYSDWHDYADTNVGDYCKLIEKIMEDTQNHAQIILMTPPYSTYTEAQEQLVINSNPVVKAIAQRYSIPVIDVLYESGMGKFNASVFRPHDGCHFNAKGYHRLGTFVGSKVKSVVSTFSLDDVYDDETT